MKTKHLISMLLAGFSAVQAATPSLRFSTPPVLERFPDGAVEWRASLNCADPSVLSGVRILFSFDFNLDGVADGIRDSTSLSPADCDRGAVHVLRTFFPTGSGILTAELWQNDAVSDRSVILAGGIGDLLSMHRFCARPTDGEPEWIEIRNNSAVRVDLTKVKVEGHVLNGGLEPGSDVIVGKDSAALLEWQPAGSLITTSSWSSLRNTGDTLRLALDNGIVLDSIIYGAVRDAREGCASAATEENAAAASGFELKISTQRWNRNAPLDIDVQAPNGGAYDLRLYDLDGFDLCELARNKTGSTHVQLSDSDCRGLGNRTGAVLLQLQPRGAAPIRRMIRMSGH